MQQNRRYLYLFIGSQFIALIGERISSIAFISLAAQLNPLDSGRSTSLVGVFQIIPIMVFSFLGGYFADKFSRKKTLLVLNVIRITIISFVLLMFKFNNASVNAIFIAVLSLGFITSLYNPGKKSFVPFLVDNKEDEIKRGNWYLTISEILAMLIGIGIGTFLLNFIPATHLLVFDAIFFIIAIPLLLFLPKKKLELFDNTHSFIQEFKTSIWIVKTNKAVLGLMLFLVLPFYISSGLFYVGASKWVAEFSPQNPGEALGRLLLFLACGALFSYVLKKTIEKKNDYVVIKYLFLSTSISIFALSVVPTQNQIMIYLFTFITGIFVGLLYPRTIYLFQLLVDEANIGKITSLNEMVFSIAFVLTVLLSLLFDDLYTYKGGWLINAIFLFITFIFIQLLQKRHFSQPK